MKNVSLTLIFSLITTVLISQNSWIRVNQIGYLENDIKVAVFISKSDVAHYSFDLVDYNSNEVVYKGTEVKNVGKTWGFDSSARLDFSEYTKPGKYFIKINDIQSVPFSIGDDIYAEASEIPLKYMRQQRCGYNPFLKDSCHVHDGITVGDPTGERNGQYFNTVGGWHDASDYLQYVATSANAVYQMLFAYSKYPESFGDLFDANGDEGANGIPDILDEAKWGLDWLVKMNPDSNTYFNQLADDRDHVGFTIPNEQKVDYGWGPGKERAVYFVSPEPQGLFSYKNRSTGMASTLGKFSSSFSLGAEILSDYYPEFAELLQQKALDAYNKGAANPGVSQTAPGGAPYFYEEDNWVDDMELAASELFKTTGENRYLTDAINYGRKEPVTPWMGADSARHYQWYPFINMGHYQIAAQNNDVKASLEFIRNMKSGIQRVKDRADDNAFMNGIPFIWCSNNLTLAFITQCRLYNDLTGDDSFLEIETAMRDWLFGCNPWGTSMIVGYPEYGDYPIDTHSAFTQLRGYPITGGVVDGPIYNSIFGSLKGIYLSKEDQYADFQSDFVVYHDDFADYSTNEPTMDGTACMTYYFGYLSSQAKNKAVESKSEITGSVSKADGDKLVSVVEGGVVRGNRNKRQLSLVFTGHEFADGAETIMHTMEKHDIKGAFFLTGAFYRLHPEISRLLQKAGHYMAPHSNKHLLYADWSKRDSTLVTRIQFEKDLRDNYLVMDSIDLSIESPRFFMPSYEWYNKEISSWANSMGVKVINFTPGTTSNADYTTPDMNNYLSSEKIYNNILRYEEKDEDGLNGFILLIHIGTDPRRTDKLYDRLDDLIIELKNRGYVFVRIDELLEENKN